jgi:glycosyltransferase involved in cell wall biosynthesis
MDNWHSPEVELLRTARSYSAEVALSMPGYIHPDLRPLKNVSFVLDLQYEYYPEFFSARELEERKRVFGAAIRMADHLLAISDYTRQTVLERFAVDPTRITTVYPAADPIFHPRCGHIRDTPVVLAKYGLAAGQYLFFPANTWPHKNHRTALQALRLLKDNYHLDPLLVCAGNVKEAQPELLRLIRHLNLTDRVRFLGYCPLPDFPALYEGAAALVFPSYFEGFGIPLAEAMWCDCPIVSSNATCLPEIAGDAALFFEPHSPEQMADAAYRILTDSELRRRLTARGRQQVKKFSWQTFTTETIRVLRQVCDLRYGAGDSNSA